MLGLLHISGYSPKELFYKKKISKYRIRYAELSNQLDSLQESLHTHHFKRDKVYREILEMDSLPAPVRYAGMGGSDPYDDYLGTLDKEFIASISQRIEAIKNQVKVQRSSYEEINKRTIQLNIDREYTPAIMPVKPNKYIWISSYYGSRSDPFTFRPRKHNGIDFVGPINTEIYSTATGTVTFVKTSRRGYGNEVVISHELGYSTRYAHLNKIMIQKGQQVRRGQVIGLMGNTGRSTGTHLHYEVRLNNRPVDPIYYYSDDLTAKEYELITKRTDRIN